MAMSSPAWLYYLFGVLMLAVAAYCLVLLSLSSVTGRRAGRDVEVSHVFMGVAMAGMFVGHWAFGPPVVWELIFGAFLVWFLVQSIESIRTYGLHLPHALIHGVMSFAMLLMYWFPMGASAGAMSMAMAPGGSHLDPGLSFLLAFSLFASAVFTLASPDKGASHFGHHRPGYAFATTPAGGGGEDGHAEDGAALVGLEEELATGWLVDLSHVIMCLAMGFMLILMI
jgi:hypothetical protein